MKGEGRGQEGQEGEEREEREEREGIGKNIGVRGDRAVAFI